MMLSTVRGRTNARRGQIRFSRDGERAGKRENEKREQELTERVRLVQPPVLHTLRDRPQLLGQISRDLVVVESVVKDLEFGRDPLEFLSDLRLKMAKNEKRGKSQRFRLFVEWREEKRSRKRKERSRLTLGGGNDLTWSNKN